MFCSSKRWFPRCCPSAPTKPVRDVTAKFCFPKSSSNSDVHEETSPMKNKLTIGQKVYLIEIIRPFESKLQFYFSCSWWEPHECLWYRNRMHYPELPLVITLQPSQSLAFCSSSNSTHHWFPFTFLFWIRGVITQTQMSFFLCPHKNPKQLLEKCPVV